MINEVLYMEARIFSEFCRRKKIPAKEANRVFNMCHIWDYIESCYSTLHMNGDDSVLDDVDMILSRRGATV